jgi:hypothetical protein
MTQFRHSPFAGQLKVVATLAGRAIDTSVAHMRSEEELSKALRQYLRQGVSIDELSNATGLTPEMIRARVGRDLAESL